MVIWIGNANLVYRDDDGYHYCLKIATTIPYRLRTPSFDLKQVVSYFNEGWPYLIKGSDEITFIEKPKVLYYSLDNAEETYINCDNYYTTIYFTLPFVLQDWMYIAPMNQYDEGITNEEIVKELNSYWPYTLNSYIDE